MSSTIEFKNYITEQLKCLDDINFRPMMGEFLLYKGGLLIGGIYDNRLLVKITDGNKKYGMETVLPYDGAKSMYQINDVDDTERLARIIIDTATSIKNKQ